MRNGKWDARIARARRLVSTYPSAAECLRFYGHIAQFQKSLYVELEIECGKRQIARLPGALQREFDLFVLMPRFTAFLGVVETNAPAPLAQAAAAQRASGGKSHLETLTGFWRPRSESDVTLRPASNLDPSQALLAWMFLQPYANISPITPCIRRSTPLRRSVRGALRNRWRECSARKATVASGR